MKYLVIICAILMIAACGLSTKTAKVPAGYQTCFNDSDCPRHHYCGFVEVDSVAVCKKKPREFDSHPQ